MACGAAGGVGVDHLSLAKGLPMSCSHSHTYSGQVTCRQAEGAHIKVVGRGLDRGEWKNLSALISALRSASINLVQLKFQPTNLAGACYIRAHHYAEHLQATKAYAGVLAGAARH